MKTVRSVSFHCATTSNVVRGSELTSARSGPVMKFAATVTALEGVHAICAPTLFDVLLSRATSQPFTISSIPASRSLNVYVALRPVCVYGRV